MSGTEQSGIARKQKQVLITGANGYLGGRICSFFEAAGHIVFAPTRAEADITKPESLETFCKDKQIDAVLHFAGLDAASCAENPENATKINAQGAENMLAAAAKAGASRFILFSTFHVYGKNAHDTISEETEALPAHPYGESKLAGEQSCQAAAAKHDVELVIFRVSNGIGAPINKDIKQWSLIALNLCREAQEQGTLTLTSPPYLLRDFVSLEDIYTATRMLLEAPAEEIKNPIFNLGSGSSISIGEFVRLIAMEFADLYGETIMPAMMEEESQDAQTKPQLDYRIDKLRALGFTPQTDLRKEIREILTFCEVFR